MQPTLNVHACDNCIYTKLDIYVNEIKVNELHMMYTYNMCQITLVFISKKKL